MLYLVRQVRPNDENTKICQECYDKVNEYLHYRESCAAKNMNFLLRKIQSSVGKTKDIIPPDLGNVITGSTPIEKYEISSDSEDSHIDCKVNWVEEDEQSDQIQLVCTEDEEIDVGSSGFWPQIEYYAVKPMRKVYRKRVHKRIAANFTIGCALGRCKELFESHEAMQYHMATYHRKTVEKSNDLRRKALKRKRKCTQPTNAPLTPANAQSTDGNGEITDVFPVKCCRRCSEVFENVPTMRYHVRTYHAKGVKRTYECYLCNTKLLEKPLLRCHMNARHILQKGFLCPFPMCPSIYYSRDHLRLHVERKHVQKTANSGQDQDANTFECYLCKKTRTQKSDLFKHMNVMHCHRKRFVCPFAMCAQVFSFAYELKRHRKSSHPGQSVPFEKIRRSRHFSFICSQYNCKEMFESHDSMWYHTSIYHAKNVRKTFECHLCKMAMGSRLRLSEHMNGEHVGEKRHKCYHGFTQQGDLCREAFKSKIELKYHVVCVHDHQQ